ncbi:hypothetical protein MMC32_003270 [Xylographa parallela]|nr:hypothetical protein [Xylographa parallela]
MSESVSQSYMEEESSPTTTDDLESVDSLPDSAESDDIDSEEEDLEESDAEREWKESLQQLELLLTMVVVPYMGKYFGRKCAYWGEISEFRIHKAKAKLVTLTGWAKFMEWKYPVEVVITSKKSFRAAGAIEAAAML